MVPLVGRAQDAGGDGAGPVGALVVGDVGRSIGIHVIEVVAFQAVADTHGRIFTDGIAKADGVTDGFLGEVVPVVVDVVDVVAEGQVGIVDARVGEGEHARRTAPGEEALQLHLIAIHITSDLFRRNSAFQ